MKKIGSIFMISVLALAGIGVSFAGFTDAISVYGTVDTAEVVIDWTGWYSGTWVYKIWGFDGEPNQMPPIVMNSGVEMTYELNNEILIYSGFTQLIPTETEVLAWASNNGGNAELEAWSYAEEYVGDAYDINMVYSDIFPCIDFCADFIFHYGGSIPARINTAEIFSIGGDDFPESSGTNFLDFLWAYNDVNTGYGAWVEAYMAQGLDDTGAETDVIADIVEWEIGESVDIGTQLHFCDYVIVKLYIHLPQDIADIDEQLQGLSGTFGGSFEVIQWYDCD